MTAPAKPTARAEKIIAAPAADPLRRCAWVSSDSLYLAYHDTEWGVPEVDDRALFEKLTLDGFQAGLSWITILRKRENFRRAFDDFDPEKIARYRAPRLRKLLADPGIVRNRQKVEAAVANARAYLALREELGSFRDFLWQFTDGKTLVHEFRSIKEIPPETDESRAMCKALTKRGFRFVGPTICYAFMQAVGMVNDHTTDCFRYREVLVHKGRTPSDRS
jgi:DNA-3-methyladenine glycosylase I